MLRFTSRATNYSSGHNRGRFTGCHGISVAGRHSTHRSDSSSDCAGRPVSLTDGGSNDAPIFEAYRNLGCPTVTYAYRNSDRIAANDAYSHPADR